MFVSPLSYPILQGGISISGGEKNRGNYILFVCGSLTLPVTSTMGLLKALFVAIVLLIPRLKGVILWAQSGIFAVKFCTVCPKMPYSSVCSDVWSGSRLHSMGRCED